MYCAMDAETKPNPADIHLPPHPLKELILQTLAIKKFWVPHHLITASTAGAELPYWMCAMS